MTLNVALVVSRPSDTLSVTIAAPVCPATGVTEMVRDAPLPPTVMAESGSKVWLLEVAPA